MRDRPRYCGAKFTSSGHDWVIAAVVAMVLRTSVAFADSTLVAIPPGEPMKRTPVAPATKLIEKKAIFGKIERTWYEYVPRSYDGTKAVPLVVAVHGGNGNGMQMSEETAWSQIADQVGFVVIYPNGSIGNEGKFRWNAYEKLNTDPDMAISADNKVDEARFFKELIEKTEKSYKIDASRVYMHGQSNGGMMVSYFGLRHPEMLAAMAVSSAPPSIDVMNQYPVKTSLPTYFWSGENDIVAGQYNPNHKSRATICKEFAEFWAKINQDDPEPRLRLDGPYNTEVYSGTAEVRSTEFRNGIHPLPFTAAYLTWNDFFSRFSRGHDGRIQQLIPEDQQAAPPDKNAIAVKFGVSFALVDGKVTRVGDTPDQAPRLIPGVHFNTALVPAKFLAAAIGGVLVADEHAVDIRLPAGTASFTTGGTTMEFNGAETELYTPTLRVDGDSMISLNAVASGVLNKKVSARKDVYRNDIFYVSDRPADLSAQTITYIDEKVTGKR